MDANFLLAWHWMMQWEDSTYSYAEVSDVGGSAISGINSAAYPTQFAAIAAIPQDQREVPIQQFYQTYVWRPWMGTLDPEVFKRVYDTRVNPGPGKAEKIFQMAINDCGQSISPDGQIGPISLAAANSVPAATLVAAFQIERANHYRKYDANSPFLAQLIARAQA